MSNNRAFRLTPLALLSALSLMACPEKEPQTYEDCILKHLKPGVDFVTAEDIKEACATKFKHHD